MKVNCRLPQKASWPLLMLYITDWSSLIVIWWVCIADIVVFVVHLWPDESLHDCLDKIYKASAPLLWHNDVWMVTLTLYIQHTDKLTFTHRFTSFKWKKKLPTIQTSGHLLGLLKQIKTPKHGNKGVPVQNRTWEMWNHNAFILLDLITHV